MKNQAKKAKLPNVQYRLTERRFAHHPRKDDPKAQIMKRHSGVYDLRDDYAHGVIVGSSSNLPAMRKWQARLNTQSMLG